jgi:hypothetical protein
MTVSGLRQELSRRLKELVRLLKSLNTHHPQVRASLYRHRVRCGRPNCHCADGPGHWRWCLSFASGGSRHTRTLSPKEVAEVSAGAQAYRRYRQSRARAARLFRDILDLVDRIQKALARPPTRR